MAKGARFEVDAFLTASNPEIVSSVTSSDHITLKIDRLTIHMEPRHAREIADLLQRAAETADRMEEAKKEAPEAAGAGE